MIDLFAPPTDEEISERQALRIKNCKGHRWMARGWSSASSWTTGGSFTLTLNATRNEWYLDTECAALTRYCIDCGMEEPKKESDDTHQGTNGTITRSIEAFS